MPRILAERRFVADERVADATRIHGSRQITDLYPLALTVRHDGTFVTFDGSVVVDAIHGAGCGGWSCFDCHKVWVDPPIETCTARPG